MKAAARAEKAILVTDDRPTASRVRELLAVLVVLLVIAGVGTLMVACTRS